ELARQLKEERDREIEEIFNEGVDHVDAGRTQLAAVAFRRVLSIQPDHRSAQELLAELDLAPELDEREAAEPELSRAEAPTVVGMAAPPTEPPAPAEPPGSPAAAEADGEAAPAAEAPPPGTSEERRKADESYRMVARAKRAPVNRFVLIGGGVAVLAVIAAWLLISNWGNLFPNSEDAPAGPRRGESIARITEIYEQGEIEAAIAALEGIESSDPDFLEAQRLASRWQAELEAARAEAEGLEGEDAVVYGELVSRAREAYGEGRYLAAARSFTRASSMAPLPAAEAALFEDAKQQLEPIAPQIDLYNQRQWELALSPLWRHLEQDEGNRDVRELLANSYYNMAVRDLRRNDPSSAFRHLRESQRLLPDPELERVQKFARTYETYPKDLLYEIFVQQLDFRR
ncbi:MAG: hypothetical protein R3190_15025, partial [Thermoanaerobaculia bacterium]|nr:hypothetical protein [Thermoanaerobaculia bacterium]